MLFSRYRLTIKRKSQHQGPDSLHKNEQALP